MTQNHRATNFGVSSWEWVGEELKKIQEKDWDDKERQRISTLKCIIDVQIMFLLVTEFSKYPIHFNPTECPLCHLEVLL